MAKKLEFPEDKIGIPECINCFSRITDHVNGVMGSFEVASSELFEDFHKKAAVSLEETALRTDRTVQEHFRRQELKEDAAMSEHFEKQSLKYDEFEKKVFGLIWKVFAFFGAVAVVASGVVGATWVSNQQKADKKDVLYLNTAKNLFELNGKYNDQRFLLKPGETIDKYNYMWYIETTFGDQSRGTSRPSADDKSKNKDNGKF